MNKIILFKGYDAVGDYLSYNGMIRHLFNRYKMVYILAKQQYHSLIKILFSDINVETIQFHEELYSINPNFDILDVRIWHYYARYPHNGIYYDNNNRYGNIPNQYFNDNASAFYSFMNISTELRLSNFYFKRLIEEENNLFTKLQLENKEYAVICEYDDITINRNYIKSNNIVNIHNISNFFDIIKVIEKAKEVHLIENSVALLVYHLQISNLMEKVNVNLHTYARKDFPRIVNKEDYMKKLPDNGTTIGMFFLNMLLSPQLNNWNIIWD